MTKSGSLKRHLAAIDDDIDKQIDEAKRIGAPALEQALLDKVLRPYSKIMEAQKLANEDPEAFVDASFWIMAVLSVECILNTNDKAQPDVVYAKMNAKMKEYAESVSIMLTTSVTSPKLN